MTIGRNNTRRRRVILDEAVQANNKLVPQDSSLEKPSFVDLANTYASGAKRRGQLKTTDLIPKRAIPVTIVVAATLFGLAVINFLAFNASSWSILSPDAVHTMSFAGVGTISSWFSSLLLMITGMASLQIYGMRRHRFDDYNGHYRVWIFLAVLFSIASINCVVDFRSIFQSLASASGLASGNGVVILLVAKLVALTALVVRGVLEIRASKSALVAVVLVWVAYASAIFTQVPSVESALVHNGEMVRGNLILVGNVALFFAVVSFARFVYLHANELIKLEKLDIKADLNSQQAVDVKGKASAKKGSRKIKRDSNVDSIDEQSESDSEAKEKIFSLPGTSSSSSSPSSPLAGKMKQSRQKKSSRKSEKSRRRAA